MTLAVECANGGPSLSVGGLTAAQQELADSLMVLEVECGNGEVIGVPSRSRDEKRLMTLFLKTQDAVGPVDFLAIDLAYDAAHAWGEGIEGARAQLSRAADDDKRRWGGADYGRKNNQRAGATRGVPRGR